MPRSYLLSGMLRCANCGGKMFNALLGESRRYVCQAGPDHGGCGRMSIVAAPTEETAAARSRVLRTPEPCPRIALPGVRVMLLIQVNSVATPCSDNEFATWQAVK